MRKTRRFILLMAIFLSLGGVGYKVAKTIIANKVREIRKNPLEALNYLPESALHMKDFHRSKIEDGRKVWEIFGDEANYYKEQKEAVVKKPRFYYYDKKGETAEATGEVARVYLNDKELEKMELQGGIQVSYQGNVLKSEEAIYVPAKDRIVLPSRTVMIGDGIELEGSSMEVELQGKKMRLLRNVKTRIEPEKLKKQKVTKPGEVAGG
ncbi:MAG: LPS export ABC transporter periplasmic protein LptC [Alphaproteobacteria bacterium]